MRRTQARPLLGSRDAGRDPGKGNSFGLAIDRTSQSEIGNSFLGALNGRFRLDLELKVDSTVDKENHGAPQFPGRGAYLRAPSDAHGRLELAWGSLQQPGID